MALRCFTRSFYDADGRKLRITTDAPAVTRDGVLRPVSLRTPREGSGEIHISELHAGEKLHLADGSVSEFNPATAHGRQGRTAGRVESLGDRGADPTPDSAAPRPPRDYAELARRGGQARAEMIRERAEGGSVSSAPRPPRDYAELARRGAQARAEMIRERAEGGMQATPHPPRDYAELARKGGQARRKSVEAWQQRLTSEADRHGVRVLQPGDTPGAHTLHVAGITLSTDTERQIRSLRQVAG